MCNVTCQFCCGYFTGWWVFRVQCQSTAHPLPRGIYSLRWSTTNWTSYFWHGNCWCWICQYRTSAERFIFTVIMLLLEYFKNSQPHEWFIYYVYACLCDFDMHRHINKPFLWLAFLQYSVTTLCDDFFVPSVLWCCWLGGRKGIQPVKTEWWVLACFIKIQNGFAFLVPAYPGCPVKSLLNGCSSCSSLCDFGVLCLGVKRIGLFLVQGQ